MGLNKDYIKKHGIDYVPVEPTPTQIACNAIRDMFFHKHYNGVVPAADMDVVKNSKSWHSIYGKQAIHEAIKQLSDEGYMTLNGDKGKWIWGFPGSNQQLFNNSLVSDIVARKEKGIDCTENESAELKYFIKNHIEFVQHCGEDNADESTLSLMEKINSLFPCEMSEAIDEAGL